MRDRGEHLRLGFAFEIVHPARRQQQQREHRGQCRAQGPYLGPKHGEDEIEAGEIAGQLEDGEKLANLGNSTPETEQVIADEIDHRNADIDPSEGRDQIRNPRLRVGHGAGVVSLGRGPYPEKPLGDEKRSDR